MSRAPFLLRCMVAAACGAAQQHALGGPDLEQIERDLLPNLPEWRDPEFR